MIGIQFEEVESEAEVVLILEWAEGFITETKGDLILLIIGQRTLGQDEGVRAQI